MPTVNVGPGSALELQQIADCLGRSKKVVVVTGAGISTNCGIPDFRSENGLYSLIQAQYDAALENPPWQDANLFDIDDAPKKRRKRWYYEVVDGEGKVVKTIDPEPPSPQQDRRSLRRPRRSSTTQDLAGVPSPSIEKPTCSRSSSRRCSAQLQNVPITEPVEPIAHPILESQAHRCSLQGEEGPTAPLELTLDPDLSVAAAPSSPLSDPPSEISDISSLRISTPSSATSSRPASRAGSIKDHSTTSNMNAGSSSASPSPMRYSTVRQMRQHSLKREGSSSVMVNSDEEPQPHSSSQGSGRSSLPNLKGRDLFDSMVWSDAFTTSIFYMFISSLRQKIQNEVVSTTETHKFIRVLRDGGRLVRNYTQNIDCLEEREGLCTDLTRGPGNKTRFHFKTQREAQPTDFDPLSAHNRGVEVVLLHGSLVALRCPICTKLSDWDEADRHSATLAGHAPDCPSCTAYNAKRTRSGRRGLAVGRLRPDIVLYGEEHPNAGLVGPLITHDLALGPDVLLILGTSLKVHGLKVMVREFAKTIHAKGGKVVFINKTKPTESAWGEFIDYWVEWDCDAWVSDLKNRRPDIWLAQGTQEDGRRRASTSVPKATSARPAALRDDRMNGVYSTFKILDILAQFQDAAGNVAPRRRYFEKASSGVATDQGRNGESSKKSVKMQKPKAPLKAESLQQEISRSAQSNTANIGKKRKSYPSALRDDKRNAAYLSTKIWETLRKLTPSLSVTPPADGRVALTVLAANAVPWFVASPLPETPFPLKAASNHLPNLGGASSWPLKSITLTSHPPSGENVSVSSKTRYGDAVRSARRATLSHSYGTRASRRWSSASSTGMRVLDERCLSSSSDTIVVDGSASKAITTLEDNAPLTPPTSDAVTPKARRIKRMGSIGAILSSPLEEGNYSEDSENSQSTVYHDVQESLY